MAWESSRPVPWSRLFKDWAIYAGIMVIVFGLVLRDQFSAGTLIGLLSSLPIYLLVGGVMAKFGYVRKTLRQLRAEAPPRAGARTAEPVSTTRSRPAPTRRTSSGPSNHRPKRKR